MVNSGCDVRFTDLVIQDAETPNEEETLVDLGYVSWAFNSILSFSGE
jgi:hypothetical protein